MQEDPPPFRAVKPDLPALPQLESVVMKALTKDRNQRYGSVLEFACDLTSAAQPSRRAEASVPPRSTRIVSQPEVPKPAQLRTTLDPSANEMKFVAIAAVALIVVLAGVWYFSQRRLKDLNPDGSIKKGDVSWSASAEKSKGEVRINPNDGLKYAWIPPSSFEMGCSPGDSECCDTDEFAKQYALTPIGPVLQEGSKFIWGEKPRHQVEITKGFWLGQTEGTVAAYIHFAGATREAMPPIQTSTKTGATTRCRL
jgi:formylglycine-generating enzyme required for sulfatase activity